MVNLAFLCMREQGAVLEWVREPRWALGALSCTSGSTPSLALRLTPARLAEEHLEVAGGTLRAQPLWSSAATFNAWPYLGAPSFGQKQVFLLHCVVWSRGRHRLLQEAPAGSTELCSWQERARARSPPPPRLPPPCVLGPEDTWRLVLCDN